MADEVTGDLFRSIELKNTACGRTNEDISINGRAGGILCSIGLGVNGGSRLGADRGNLSYGDE